MTNNDNHRDIIHEIADVLTSLGDDYTPTKVECDPGDSAVRITKRNNEKTLYIIAYSEPDDTEIRLYDKHDDLTAQSFLYNSAFGELYPGEIADYIRKSL
jgi:hypothetical protein